MFADNNYRQRDFGCGPDRISCLEIYFIFYYDVGGDGGNGDGVHDVFYLLSRLPSQSLDIFFQVECYILRLEITSKLELSLVNMLKIWPEALCW